MKHFMTLLNSFQPLTNIKRNPTLDAVEVLNPSLLFYMPIVLQIERLKDGAPERRFE